jgi:hypothetical protein
MKVKVTEFTSNKPMWVNITTARRIYRSTVSESTIIEWDDVDHIFVVETPEQISEMLPGGLHEH